MTTPSERLYDLDVSHQIGLQRYGAGTVKRILSLLADVETDLVAQILKLSWDDLQRESARSARLNAMLDAIRVTTREGYAVLQKELRGDLIDLAAYEAEFQSTNLGKALSVEPDSFVQPTAEQLKAAVDSRPFQGRVLKEWGQDLEAGAFKRVRDAIRIGYVEGESVGQIVTRIRGTKAMRFKDSILEISRRGAEGVVRTAVAHTANAAKEEFFKANPETIKGVRWSSVLDSRTTPVCRARDGKVYPVGEGPRPPAHFRCRSTTVAVLDDVGPPEETYQDWLKRQPAEVQDDVLGPSKAKLFRDGDLELDRFVDASGREYTLQQLRRRERKAFEAAGVELRSDGRAVKGLASAIPPLADSEAWKAASTPAERRRAAVDWVRKGQEDTGKEHVAVLSQEGELVFSGSGESNRVRVSLPDDLRSSVAIHHSHPDDVSLSMADFRATWGLPGPSSVSAHTRAGSTFTGRALENPASWSKARERAREVVASELRVLGRRRKEDLSQLTAHLVNEALAEVGSVWYKSTLSVAAKRVLASIETELVDIRRAALAAVKDE
jgi:SPP1 gp7 family putative phage head morphogenesis protein